MGKCFGDGFFDVFSISEYVSVKILSIYTVWTKKSMNYIFVVFDCPRLYVTHLIAFSRGRKMSLKFEQTNYNLTLPKKVPCQQCHWHSQYLPWHRSTQSLQVRYHLPHLPSNPSFTFNKTLPHQAWFNSDSTVITPPSLYQPRHQRDAQKLEVSQIWEFLKSKNRSTDMLQIQIQMLN